MLAFLRLDMSKKIDNVASNIGKIIQQGIYQTQH
jgi:hypothetical protein